MGEVISISRVSDLDILSEFDSQCPAIPIDIDQSIRQSAESALESRGRTRQYVSFRMAGILVVAVSILALVMVKYVSNHLANGLSSTQINSAFLSGSPQWRESQVSWAAYIQKLENDPVVVQLRTEQELFRQQFP